MKGNLNKVIKEIEKSNMKMIKDSLRDSAKIVKKRAKEESPVVTGAFKKAIRHSVKGKVKIGEAQAQVGIFKNSPVMKYARKVENKHRIFRTLEVTEKKPVTNAFVLGLRKYWNKKRIKS